ncbi:MAG: hypothetical protein C4557_00160 [Anaerolineaceae bacterium]|jgi:hypothetical protein|nr:MAG: hypothetical protein C4557_00160 [Anaerolineaceae bacterium]
MTNFSKTFHVLRKWKAKISLIIGIGVIGFFLYWIWNYGDEILGIFRKVEVSQIVVLVISISTSVILTAYALVILVRAKGHTSFKLSDSYHSLNFSQLASMIPGGIWGYAGFAGALWAKGIPKADSAIIIILHTLTMLSACAFVGVIGLASIFGWHYATAPLIPFLFLVLGRNLLDKVRKRIFPTSSGLPFTADLLKSLCLGIIVWLIMASCFTWFLFTIEGHDAIPFWTVAGAYTGGYLGGYLAIIAPSGLGVSEGLIALMLSSFINSEKALSIAISFRIVHVLVIWFNVLISVILTAKGIRKTQS